MSEEVITTCTRDCPCSCGLVVTVEGGCAVRIRGNPAHPFSRGKICRKAVHYLDRVYNPERVLHPLKKHHGQWVRISWDEALDEIAGRMRALKDADGPEAVLYYQGFGERTALKLLNNRFFNLFGGVSTLAGTLCGGTGQAAQNLDFGCRVSHDPLDHLNSRTLILWGRNPLRTGIGLVPVMREVKQRGGTVVVVDPIATESARLADIHIQPAPGRDAYLALAAAKIILARGRQAGAFLRHHAEGYPEYQKILESFSLSQLAAMCDVPVETIERLAGLMTDNRPAAVVLGWGVHRYRYAHLAIRAIDALGAVSGNIGVSGGGVSQGFEEYGPYDERLAGFDLCPPRRKLLMPVIGQEILDAKDPPIRMIFVTAGNPVCMAPNSRKVARAFTQTDLVVLAGQFLDDTSDYADIFLPCTTFLEERDIVAAYGHNYVGPVNPAIAPRGETKSNFELFQGLAERFPFAEEYNPGVDEWLTLLCRPLLEQGLSLEDLRRGPVRIPGAPMVPYHDFTFATPSGKFRFLTELESGPDTIDGAFPYRLLSISPMGHVGSELTLTDHDPLPTVWLNDGEAARLGLEAGQRVRVRSEVGAIDAVLRPAADMRRDTVACPRGGWIKAGHGVNRVTVDLVSRVGNGTPYYETRVAVEPA